MSQFICKTVGKLELSLKINYPPDWVPTNIWLAIVFFHGGQFLSEALL